MKLIALRCPCCNGELNVDAEREFTFCQYCGTKIMLDDERKVLEGAVAASRSYDVNNYLKRAQRFEEAEDEEHALEYYNKALDIDADCREAIEGIERIKTNVTEPNLFIKYDKTSGFPAKVDLYINTNMVETLSPGDTTAYICTVGTHSIRLKVNEIVIDALFSVPDKYTDGYLTFGKWGNQGLAAYGDGVKVLTKKRRVDKLPRPESSYTSERVYEPRGETESSGCSGCLIKVLAGCMVLFLIAALAS